jgi:hypothetical protein
VESKVRRAAALICMGKQAAFKVMGWLSGQRKALKKMKIKIKNIKIMIKTKINSQIYIGKTKNEDKK